MKTPVHILKEDMLIPYAAEQKTVIYQCTLIYIKLIYLKYTRKFKRKKQWHE